MYQPAVDSIRLLEGDKYPTQSKILVMFGAIKERIKKILKKSMCNM
jgi:hypothetical protein